MAITFSAEVTKCEVKRAASLDRVYKIILETDQEQALALQKYIATEPVVIEVKECK